MLHALAIVAVAILTLCVWLIFRPEPAETAAYAGYLDRKQRKLDLRELRRKRPPSEGSVCVIALSPFIVILVIWLLFH